MKIKKNVSLLSFCASTGFLLAPIPSAMADDHVAEVIVEASVLHKKQAEIAQFATVLSQEDLRNSLSRSLGGTLENELGVRSDSFGPGVGRPVIRGQVGQRVKVMQDAVDSLDVSAASPDHAISIEPLLIERVEIIRGPNTLAYGSGAIGGIVNVVDNRIPAERVESVQGAFEQRYSTAADESTSVGKIEFGLESLAVHLDGFYRESNDVEIDGVAVEGESSPSGYIPNTQSRAKGGTIGFSWIGEDSLLGFSYNRLENKYGIPQEEVGENIDLDIEQDRFDVKAEVKDPFAGVNDLKIRLGYNDYEHVEIANGEPETVFENEAFETRIELTNDDWNGIHSVYGVQWLDREFAAIGDEAFIPESDIEAYGFFLVQDYHHGSTRYEWGLRYEDQEISPEGMGSESHDALSLSLSALIELNANNNLAVVLSRSERAPTVEELFSDGVHEATGTFDLGDPDLDVETANSIEVSWRYQDEGMRAQINVFYNQIEDFIYQRSRGDEFDEDTESFVATCPPANECVPVLAYVGEDADFTGFEAEVEWALAEVANAPLNLRLFTDYVRAELDEGGDVPRIPPWRYGFELSHAPGKVDSFLRVSHSDEQDKPGDNESETDSYTKVALGVDWHFGNGGGKEGLDHTLFLHLNNAFDEEIRNSTSFLREVAPEPGRSLVIGYRAQF